ncbi:MAG: GumC family protein [Terriglobales bacterium]
MESGKLVHQQVGIERPAAGAFDARVLMSPGYATAENHDNALMDIWHLILKHRWIITATFVIVMALATVYTFRSAPLYQGVGQIAINRDSADVLGFKDMPTDESASTDDWDYNVALDTQVRVLQSDSLALLVIKELHLETNPYFADSYANAPERTESGAPRAMTPAEESVLLRNFERSLEISKVPRTRIVEIRFLSPDPQLSALVVNTLINAYIEQNFRTKYESTMQTTNWLQKQLTDLQMKVETSQQKLVAYQKDNEILGIDEKQNIITAKLTELNQELTAAEADRMQRQALFDLTKNGASDALPGVTDNRVIQKLKEQEADLKDQYAQATTRFGPSYPKVQELSNQLAQVESALKNELSRVVQRIHNEYQESVTREGMLRAALDNQKKEANRLNERAIDYNLLKREVDTNRQLYEGLLQKMKEASVSAGLRSGNIRILDAARVPFRPAKPNIPFNLMVAAFIGLSLGVTLAYVSDNLDNTIRDPDEVPAITGLQPLAVIPLSFAKTRKVSDRKSITADAEKGESAAMIAHNRPKSESAESYRALRTSILLSSFGAAPKVIVTTSGLPQEGKTTTSANTAIVLAQRGGRVLLVEADMRRPALSRLLNMKKHVGLSDLLAGIITMEQAIVPSPTVPNLDLIVAGTPTPNPAELLGSPTMKACLAQWREKYDHIVIDTPPVLTVTDAVLLSTEADAVLLVIRAGQTAQPALRRTRDLLNLVNARVVGVVVNAFDLHSNGYRYYNTYYSGYGKYGRYNHYYQQDETEAATSSK